MKRVLSLVILMGCAAAPESEPAPSAAAFPGVDVDGIAACVRDNATEAERAALAAGGEVATDATAAILARPETVACLQTNNVSLPA